MDCNRNGIGIENKNKTKNCKDVINIIVEIHIYLIEKIQHNIRKVAQNLL